ncbi:MULTISPECIES: DUF4440 domain-containing protein [Paraburkholderia]|uniref:DUF4440 domain-containing protein n=1 Tax=Paraburkholderia TaxID=1822464 RepID=UPI0022561DBC|nr:MULTISPECIES: DUF4440 domain-containing protein [Paraburkholderia]MCX4164900.1 DUF4440 domain-containing protein [Paraburkholderia megapolitana]MDN7160393.1 DUF4440 domain-containing protein [Paraburkholderia sp. CHISQ3]MDQ6497440.1 DUF4440 domain-containing protein [Paraburkholderia megapolitana]
MNPPNPFFQEIVDAHVDIEQWLSGRAEAGRLAALLNRFSSRFSMVTLQGLRFDRTAVDRLFSQGHGKRPGLRIEIDELRDIDMWRDGAVVGYRETQIDESGSCTVRRSTAVLACDESGRVTWRHLQETSVAL